MNFSRLTTDLLALTLFTLTVFGLMSLVSFHPGDPPAEFVYPASLQVHNFCGRVGALFAYHSVYYLGLAAYMALVGFAIFDCQLFSRNILRDPFLRIMGWLLVVGSTATALELFMPQTSLPLLVGNGGYVGTFLSQQIQHEFSGVGSAVLLGAVAVAGLILAMDTWFEMIWLVVRHTIGRVLSGVLACVKGMGNILLSILFFFVPSRWKNGAPEKVAVTPALASALEKMEAETDIVVKQPVPIKAPVVKQPEPVVVAADVDDEDDVAIDEEFEAPVAVVTPPAKKGLFKVNPPTVITPEKIKPVTSNMGQSDIEYELPSPTMLDVAEDFPYELLATKAQSAAATLEKTFKEFNLNVTVSEIDTGPVITQFELNLEPGLRVNKVTALADDLAIALRVPSVRVVNSIPGKNTVGVEVPNEKQIMVRMRELIESTTAETEKMRLPLFLGKNVSGHPLVVDLAKMPHLLIAGRTGTGKSVCLNTLILSLLMTRRPDQVKMIMIDPKMVELSPYTNVPHMMHPVITDMKKAEAVLAWAVDKMEERYDLLSKCGVRHIDNYNKLGKAEVLDRLGLDPDSEEAAEIPESMPYIVMIADEMADMIMTSGKDVEGHIIRLAQKSRAIGIHLVLATQKPTVDVITGLIKSNLPARISFQVSSRTDSRVVLDENGAEKLLGCGDMLYLAPGTSNLSRAQGTYVSDDEVNQVIDFLSVHEPQYSPELQRVSASGGTGGKAGIEAIRARDELYEQACEIIIREGRGSVSLLQRYLGIGYGRAARLVDYMAEDGIVGDYNGSQAREVQYTMEQWESLKSGEPVGA
jgi:S-DNA-T family DNA segregation ATPase FtsK/SpoIIIE